MSKTVKAQAKWQGGMRIDTTAGNHTMIVDQPVAGGGEDQGPNPMEYLLFSLGGCLGAMAAIIAKQERIDLRGFSAEIEGDYDPAFLMGKTTEGRAGFTDIRAVITIDSDLTDEEKEAFLKEIDSRCPISDNLINNVDVTFSLA